MTSPQLSSPSAIRMKQPQNHLPQEQQAMAINEMIRLQAENDSPNQLISGALETLEVAPAMSAVANIPWELRAIGAEEVGVLLGLAARTVLENVACRPGFPVRLTMRPASWIAGEIVEWRNVNRAGIPKGRRRGR